MARPPSLKQRRLARELARLRGEAGLTIEQASERSGISTTKISRAENAIYRVASDDVRTLGETYGADTATVERLATLARTSRQRGWWVPYKIADHLAAYLELEDEARAESAWTIDIVTGLLQTESYARALVRATRPHMTTDEVEERVTLRMRRQERRLNDIQLWAVIGEPALMYPVGGAAVMREQLEHLARMAEQPNVVIQILPFGVGAGPAMGAPFHVFDLGELGPPTAHIDYHTGSVYVEDEEEVTEYVRTFQHLTASAISPSESVQRILRAVEEMT